MSPPTSSYHHLILWLIIIISGSGTVSGSGYFELQLLEGIRNSTTVHVCLKEFWNSQINLNRCTFGQKTIVYNEPFQHSNHQRYFYSHGQHNQIKSSSSMIKIPFSFRWIGSFSFSIHLSDVSSTNRFIVEDEFAIPGVPWKYRTFHASDGRIISIRFRIDCDLYYHSDDCATFCRARNDTFGHYSCEHNGRKQCLPGWKGENCDKPKCRNGCNEAHGFCENPGECTCRSGWKGLNCDECVPYPGCLHGYCVSPFQCICQRNWGGILCDQDLNYCGTHEPCLNEGRCENIAPDNYRCVCKKGFSGVNCQIVEDACATSPCLHEGTCITLANGTDFQCICRNGFSGKRCENDLNECVSQPCLNGATCHDLENNFRCTCPSGWTGDRCELDVDECSALVTPCIKASACININGSYICVCEKGFEGVFCENEVDDCKHNQINCQNGGFCIDLVNDYRCVCATGFTGPRCDRIDESVCDLLPNHVWRMNETGCEKICVCQNNSKVTCKCQEEQTKCLIKQEELGDDLAEIRVVFDSPASQQSCNTIHSIHSLLTPPPTAPLDQDSDEPTSSSTLMMDEFCCNVQETNQNEVIINVHRHNPLAQYITRTIFPHILHVVVNTQHNIHDKRSAEWPFINLFIIAVFSLTSASGLLYAKSYLKRRQQEVDAENVVIHCIQNNLKTKPSSTMTTTTTNSANNHHQHRSNHHDSLTNFRPLTPPKSCNNTLTKSSTIASAVAAIHQQTLPPPHLQMHHHIHQPFTNKLDHSPINTKQQQHIIKTAQFDDD